MDILLESLREEWSALLRIAPRIPVALIVFLVCSLLGRLFGRGLVRVLEKSALTRTHRQFFRTLVVWLLGLVGLMLALNLLGLKGIAASLLAGGGVTAIVVGFAFRGIGENLLAGLFLAFSRPFEMGDLIQSGELQGTVRDIELRSTHIRTADGRDVFIPSARLFESPLINFTKDGLSRLSFNAGIDYRNDARKARELLLETVSAVDGVLDEPAPLVTVASLGPQYVELEIGFWSDTFSTGTDLPQVRFEVIERCRRTLLEGGFTVSSEVNTNVSLAGRAALDVELAR
ncbi:MAG: mechanosensitive ion channel family protein [Acidobacteriota bacterium]|nr:MAG: mechanosensitive ion channel family protein [Acidobacteriota bacterium]